MHSSSTNPPLPRHQPNQHYNGKKLLLDQARQAGDVDALLSEPNLLSSKPGTEQSTGSASKAKPGDPWDLGVNFQDLVKKGAQRSVESG